MSVRHAQWDEWRADALKERTVWGRSVEQDRIVDLIDTLRAVEAEAIAMVDLAEITPNPDMASALQLAARGIVGRLDAAPSDAERGSE